MNATARRHLLAHRAALEAFERDADRVAAWGVHIADVLVRGGRLLAAGNGGSAAEAQHLTAELVGRYRDDRPAYSAIALSAETSSLTAIANDYGYQESFARQVSAHGRAGDILMLLSTSGRSPNVLACIEPANRAGLTTWALTGPGPNPLASACDDAVCVAAPTTAAVQEIHLLALHLLCAAAEPTLATGGSVTAGVGMVSP